MENSSEANGECAGSNHLGSTMAGLSRDEILKRIHDELVRLTVMAAEEDINQLEMRYKEGSTQLEHKRGNLQNRIAFWRGWQNLQASTLLNFK